MARLFPTTSDEALYRAQFTAYSRQIPLLYGILCINTIILAATNYDIAPGVMTIVIPAVMVTACILRTIKWLRLEHDKITLAIIDRMLIQTYWLGTITAGAFISWALTLLHYADTAHQGHIAFYAGLTVIACIFCMMHLVRAAILVSTVVLVPFVVVFGMSGETTYVAIAVNMVFVAFAMAIVMSNHHREFSQLIESRRLLSERQMETQRLSDENSRLANQDSLTGLPNRREFFAEVGKRVADPAQRRFAVGVIDLDGFKPVNDAFGHGVGDRVLIEAGHRLTSMAGSGILVARLGGDEFGLLLDCGHDDIALHELGDRITETMRIPIQVDEAAAQVSSSIGFAIYPDAGNSARELFERADYALYFAKQNARGQTIIFSAEHEAAITRESQIEQAMRSADLANELAVAFQPVVDSTTGRTICVEALARWTSPTLGPIAPGIFIPIAERSHLIGHITRIIARKAIAAAKTWPSDVRLSFNLSARDLCSRERVSELAAIIINEGFDPRRLDVEITETAVMRDTRASLATIASLRALGVTIALDDFGTGQSSLSYVHQLPIGKIKIDRSFIVDIVQNKISRDIVRTVVSLAQNLGVPCVVEGMEDDVQVEVLRGLGCRLMQGYHFARPMTEQALRTWFARDIESARPTALRA